LIERAGAGFGFRTMIGKFFRIPAAFGFVWHFNGSWRGAGIDRRWCCSGSGSRGQAQTRSLHRTDAMHFASAPTHFCAVMRHNPRPRHRRIQQPARQQERQLTCAACPNLAATAVSLSISPCQFRQDSFAVIGFVSQFFHRHRAPSARRALSAAIPHARTTAGLARSDNCLAPKRTDGSPSHLAVSCMTIRILRTKESWLNGQERQPRTGRGEFNSS
jgi:hypothetical protein